MERESIIFFQDSTVIGSFECTASSRKTQMFDLFTVAMKGCCVHMMNPLRVFILQSVNTAEAINMKCQRMLRTFFCCSTVGQLAMKNMELITETAARD